MHSASFDTYKRLAAALSIAVAALLACNAPPDPIDMPTAQGAAHMDIASGNNQSAVKANPLPAPLSVLVTDTKGAPVRDVPVVWTVQSGGGTLDSHTVLTDASGISSVHWTLGSTAGAQSTLAVVEHLSFPALFTATALENPIGPPPNTGGSVILHYDGSAWSTSLADGSGLALSFSSIWGAGSTRAFAVGKCRGVALISTWDGNHWSVPTETVCSGGTLSRYTGVWGNTASDAFAVRRDPLPPSLSSNVLHYNGQTWASALFRGCSMCGGYTAVTTTGANSAIVVGDSGIVVRYDGTQWTPEASGTTSNLNAVWSAGPSNPVFAVGDGGTIISYAGASTGWQPQASGTTGALKAVWGTSATDVFAAGAGGIILHFNGTSWSAQASGTSQDLNGVWGASSSSVFAVGNANTILHYDGISWTAQPANAAIDLSGVWGSSGSDVFAVGTARYP